MEESIPTLGSLEMGAPREECGFCGVSQTGLSSDPDPTTGKL